MAGRSRRRSTSAAGTSADALLAEHLAAGRFVDFRLTPPELMASLTATLEAAP